MFGFAQIEFEHPVGLVLTHAINNLGWLSSCPRIFMGLTLVHFQKYWLLSGLKIFTLLFIFEYVSHKIVKKCLCEKGQKNEIGRFPFCQLHQRDSSLKGFSLALGFGLLHGTVVEVISRRNTPTPWLTILLVLGKCRVKQNSC